MAKNTLRFSFIALLALFPLSESLAQENIDPPVDITTLESVGMLGHSDQKSLGNDLYRGSKRSVLIEYIGMIPTHSDSFVIQTLTNRFLLTSADVGAIENDVETAPGNDLLTLRLEALLRRGLYDKAFSLYSSLSTPPYHERLARAGIMSMLGNGEKALACIEAKTLFPRFGKSTLWQELSAYCSLTLSETSDKKYQEIINRSKKSVLKLLCGSENYKFPYSPEFYDALTRLEKAVVAAEGRIIIPSISDDGQHSLPAAHIQALMKAPDALTHQDQILLIAEGIKKGVIDPEALTAFYKKAVDNSTKKTKPSDNTGELSDLAYLIYKNPEDSMRYVYSQKILDIAAKYGPGVITPFVSYIGGEKLGNLSLKEAQTTIEAFFLAQKHPPAALQESLAQLQPSTKEDERRRKRLQTALNLMIYSAEESDGQSIDLIEYLQNNTLLLTTRDKNIIENIDKAEGGHDNVLKVYENGFDKEIKSSYTMPSLDLQIRLEESGQNHFPGETVVLSSLVSNAGRQNIAHDAAFPVILKSLENVGLIKESYRLAVEALLME